MVRHALDAFPCLRLIPAEPRIGGPGACVSLVRMRLLKIDSARRFLRVLKEGGGGHTYIHNMLDGCPAVGLPGLGLSDEERGMVQLFDPSARTAEGGLETSGFFCAKFQKDRSMFVDERTRS